MDKLVSITIVTFNNAHDIGRCLDSVATQTYQNVEVIVVDNASVDGTFAVLKGYPGVTSIRNESNVGFSAAQNQAIKRANGDWVFCLNPDTKLERNCIHQLLRGGELHERIGIVSPKIHRMRPGGEVSDPAILDSAGAYMTPSLRHFDRGSEEIDYGQFDRPEYVFGYTGAAVLFRRELIDDISVSGEFMDENFFFYREDADLSWRSQLRQWRCLYMPAALVYHVRKVLPSNRRSLPAAINLHSTKNRFLMRINNMTAGVYTKVCVPATLRDCGILLYVFMLERSSLPGLIWIIRNAHQLFARRRQIQSIKTASDSDLKFWFANTPRNIPLETGLLSRLEMNSTEYRHARSQ